MTAAGRSYDAIGGVVGSSIGDAFVREGFLKRIETPPSASVLHVPVGLRQRHSMVMAQLLEGMADGNVEACALEIARTKLLLGPVPRGINVRFELARRLERRKAGSYEELLSRADHQCRTRRDVALKKRACPKHGSRARRARALVTEGAYSKVAASVHTEVAELDEHRQLEWKLCRRVLDPRWRVRLRAKHLRVKKVPVGMCWLVCISGRCRLLVCPAHGQNIYGNFSLSVIGELLPD